MKIRDLLLALLVMAIWGLNFVVVKFSLKTLDPLLMTALRFTFAAFPAVFFLPRPRVAWSFLWGYGLLFGVAVWGLSNLGIGAGLSPGLASLVIQSAAFFSLAIGYWAFNERLRFHQWVACAFAAAGLICVMLVTDGSMSLTGLVLVILGAFGWALSNLVVKRAGASDPLAFLVWSCMFAPLPLCLLSAGMHGWSAVGRQLWQMDSTAWLAIAYQVYPGTLFGYSVWNYLLKRYPINQVAPLSLLVPVFGLGGSALLFSEALPAMKLLAGALIIVGLFVNVTGHRWLLLKKKPAGWQA